MRSPASTTTGSCARSSRWCRPPCAPTRSSAARPAGRSRTCRSSSTPAACPTCRRHGRCTRSSCTPRGDGRLGRELEPPTRVVRHDGDDTYLVVAADKGTASFSDIANGVAAEYGFWLGDAFASGGSAGYDHKAMGITARGGWESVKRHFRELGQNIQEEDFTCVGIGDMSGDVLGNAVLLSPHTKLIGEFNHVH